MEHDNMDAMDAAAREFGRWFAEIYLKPDPVTYIGAILDHVRPVPSIPPDVFVVPKTCGSPEGRKLPFFDPAFADNPPLDEGCQGETFSSFLNVLSLADWTELRKLTEVFAKHRIQIQVGRKSVKAIYPDGIVAPWELTFDGTSVYTQAQCSGQHVDNMGPINHELGDRLKYNLMSFLALVAQEMRWHMATAESG